jgi:Cu/Ag efflux pump CusA
MGGLLPLAVERSAMYSPLAFVILGGLISSTVLSRIVTPVLYLLLPPKVTPELQPEPIAAFDDQGRQEICATEV